MDWLKKLLEGLSEEQIKKIIEGVEKNYEGYIPKHRFDEINEAKKQLEKDIADRDKQLEELKKSVGDNKELQKQIEELEAANKQSTEDYQAKLKDMTVTTAIKLAVAGEVHDPDLIVSLLDKTKIEVNEDGSVKGGLEDQIKALQTSKAFLFVEKDQDGKGKFRGIAPPDSNKGGGGTTKNPWSKEHFNLTEQGRILREDPELAKQLQAQI